MPQIAKADRESAEDLDNLEVPYDDPYNFPDVEPQPRCMYDDCLEPGRPVGYSDIPSGVSAIAFSRSKYPTGAEAIEALAQAREKFTWVDTRLYWTQKHWFFRVVLKP